MSKPRKTTPQPPKPVTKGAASRPKPARRPTPKAWVEVANFVLTFESRNTRAGGHEERITAHKMQEGGITATWTGAELRPMCQWIGEHVGDWAEHAPAPTAEAVRGSASNGAAPAPLPQLNLAIAQLRAVPATQGRAAAMGAPGAAQRPMSRTDADTFNLEAVLEISADGPLDPALPPTRCPVEFFSRNMLTTEKQRLGEASTVEWVPGRLSYAATLSRVRLPVDTYRLDCVARLPNATRPFAYLQGPLLQVA